MKKRFLVGTLLVLISVAANAQSLSPALKLAVGRWQQVKSNGELGGQMEMYLQDGKLFGKIVKTSLPPTCDKCSGDLKGKPMIGLVAIRDFSPEGDTWTGGTMVDAESGKVYKGKIKAEGNNLLVRGFIGFSMIGRTETWKRVE
jgi:uncharacterized protein (DUF2147 family)